LVTALEQSVGSLAGYEGREKGMAYNHEKKNFPRQHLELRDRKDEIWEGIPALDGAYQISSFGRVKALRRFVERASNWGFWKKEQILKLRLSSKPVSNGKRKLWRL
jgi:hypothetical protein